MPTTLPSSLETSGAEHRRPTTGVTCGSRSLPEVQRASKPHLSASFVSIVPIIRARAFDGIFADGNGIMRRRCMEHRNRKEAQIYLNAKEGKPTPNGCCLTFYRAPRCARLRIRLTAKGFSVVLMFRNTAGNGTYYSAVRSEGCLGIYCLYVFAAFTKFLLNEINRTHSRVTSITARETLSLLNKLR